MTAMRGRGRAGRCRSAADDAAFRQKVDDAKAAKNLSDVVGRHTTLKKRGREQVGLCPFHDEKTPSFEVNDAKGLFYCHGCAATGDHFKALMLLDGLSFGEAYAALTGDEFPTVDPADRAKAIQEDAAARAAAIEDARYMLSRCAPVWGTPAERYLREVRGLTRLPAAVRFGVVPASRDDNGNWKRPYPAVVLPCVTDEDGVVGLQRIFLNDDGSGTRWGKQSKLSLGRPRGAAVRLSSANPIEVVVCEGPEDGLSLAQEMPEASVWVALGTAMMPEMQFPVAVRSIVLARQNDAPAVAAAAKTRSAMIERGLAVREISPADGFKDWNDQLRGVRA